MHSSSHLVSIWLASGCHLNNTTPGIAKHFVAYIMIHPELFMSNEQTNDPTFDTVAFDTPPPTSKLQSCAP